MAIRWPWLPVVSTILACGLVLACIFVADRSGLPREGDDSMNHSQFPVEHVRLESNKRFDEVAQAFEKQLGAFDPEVRKAAIESADPEQAKAKIAARAG